MNKPDRLNISDLEVKDIIEDIFEDKEKDAEIETEKAVTMLKNRIEFYRSSTLEDVLSKIEVPTAISSARNADELKIAIYTALLDERGKLELSDEECKSIDDIISGLTDDQSKLAIEWYKNRVINEFRRIKTEKARKEYTLFKYMSDEEVKEYIDKYKEAYLAGSLLNARKSSIHYAAKECNASDPLCLAYEEPVEEKTTKIVKREKQNLKDYSIKKRIKEDMAGLFKAIEEHAPNLARAIIGSHLFGIFLTVALNSELDISSPQRVMLFMTTSSLITAAASVIICSKNIINYMEDQMVINEAKKTGLYDLAIKYGRACSDLTTFENAIKNSAKKIETGRTM